jgi:hypothetical protein
MAEPAVQPRDHRDQFSAPSPEVQARLRAENAERVRQLALIQHPAVAARETRALETAAEEALLATDPHQDLAAAQQARAEAQQAVAEAELPLANARAFVDELKAQERAAREAEIMATARLAQSFARSEPPRLELSAVEETARRRGVGQAAVEQLEQALAAAKARLAECDATVRRAAAGVLIIEGVFMAKAIEEAEAKIAADRLALASLVATLTDATRHAGGLALPRRVSRCLVDHADRLVGMLDRGRWQDRLAALVAEPLARSGEAGGVDVSFE